MSEERQVYRTEVLQTLCNPDTMTGEHGGFVEVRTRRNKLVFRFDPVRMLIEWREGADCELIDLLPYLTR